VNQSGGYITVYSEPGYGTVFKVLLPRVDERPSIISIRPPKQHFDGEETILLIEDDPRVRAAASRVLRSHGYRILDASNGATALALANAHRGEVELVLSDVVMPDANGPDVVARLRESQPDLRALFMSGYTSHAVLSNGLLEPGINLLQKPFTPEFLVKRVRQVLDAA
jgi:DNA-binding NtrC family response regulator